jgi:hypothetical protein
MLKEDKIEILSKGLFLALILFLSTVIYLLIQQDTQHLIIVGTFLVPIILGYCLIGVFIQLIVYGNSLKSEVSPIFSGAAIIYWIFLITTVVMLCASFIPQVIRYTITINIIVLFGVWLINYLYLKNIADELNSELGYYSQVLVEDLNEKPQTEDIFMEEIKYYCKRNNLDLEIIWYGIPANIKMNNINYTVKLGEYYSILGNVIYTLEFHNNFSQTQNNVK